MFAVFIDQVSPRIQYILEEFLGRRLQKSLKIFSDPLAFGADDSKIKLQYAPEKRHDVPGFWIYRDAFILESAVNPYFDPKQTHFHLSEKSKTHLRNKLSPYNISQKETKRIEGLLSSPLPALFPKESPLGFDFFSFAFYYLSRYEEYQSFQADSFGRFPFKESLDSQRKIDAVPLVDIAFFYLLSALDLENLLPPMVIKPSIDIDIAFQYKGRSWRRSILSALYFPKTIIERLRVFSGLIEDPFDPRIHVLSFIKNLKKPAAVFWLVSKETKGVNRQVNRSYMPFQQAITDLNSISEIGIHPSYRKHPSRAWNAEKKWLESLVKKPIIHSRQHFLGLKFPETYQTLLSLGIRHDWSMGYAEKIGFRAGTAFDFNWFDLSKNETTELVIHPFCIMDVTAKNYMRLRPSEAVNAALYLQEMLFLFGGSFTFIVHNESLSNHAGWENWRHVFEKWNSFMLEEIGDQNVGNQ